ncbi:hypothetical protein WT08_00125 [Burkholderia sp. MSMB1552]|nr:hypothetical protein WT08_00125 [Burkholderia sp. MSMB1552]KWZ50459.1 hypothetical protein WS92_23995 [Burkholderia sp. MSMB1588]
MHFDTAFDHPAPWQPHETLLRLGQLDDLQLDAVVTRGLRRTVAGITQISKSVLYRLAHGLRNLPCRLFT